MTDIEFVAEVKRLRSNMAAMREFLKQPGHLDRLFDLAIKGAKKPPRSRARTALPARFPDQPQVDRAKGFWAMEKRPDLVLAADQQVGEFRDYHTGRGTLAADWPATWGTWMRRALQFTRPPRSGPVAVPPPFDETNVAGWLLRLEIFYGVDYGSDGESGGWHPRWGEPPDRAGNKVPNDSWALFQAKHHEPRAAAARAK